MKFKLTGKVTARLVHKVKKNDGSSYDRYDLEIEEPGIYPNIFKVSTKDPSLLGQKDGPMAVGRLVTCEGFVSSRSKVVNGVSGQFTTYDVYLTLTRIAPFGQAKVLNQPSEESVEDFTF